MIPNRYAGKVELYLMLQNYLDYVVTISGFYNMKMTEIGSPLLTSDDWYVAKIFVQFLKVFYNSTLTLYRVYYPTFPKAIHQILEMSEMLNMYREDEILSTAIIAMEN